MCKLSFSLKSAALFSLLLLARYSHGQALTLVQLLATTEYGPDGGPALRTLHLASGPAAKAPVAPLQLVPNATPGWLSLAGTLPTDAPLTAEVLGIASTRPVATRTWRGLTAGRVQLELNLRSVPAGAYVLRLTQAGRQWGLPLAIK